MALKPNLSLDRLIVDISRWFARTHTHTHTHTEAILWASDQLVAGAATCTTPTNRRTLMPSEGFERAIPAFNRLQTYVLDLRVNGIHNCVVYLYTTEGLSDTAVLYSFCPPKATMRGLGLNTDPLWWPTVCDMAWRRQPYMECHWLGPQVIRGRVWFNFVLDFEVTTSYNWPTLSFKERFWHFDTPLVEGCKNTWTQVTMETDFELWRLIYSGPSSELDSWHTYTYRELKGATTILNKRCSLWSDL